MAVARSGMAREIPEAADREYGRFGRPNILPLTRARPVRSGSATHSAARTEPRRRRASQRPRIGCCGELGGVSWSIRK